MSPIQNEYWSVGNEMQDTKKPYELGAFMRAKERIREIEAQLPINKQDRKQAIINKFRLKGINMLNRQLFISEETEEYFSFLSDVEQGRHYDKDRFNELDNNSQDYIDEFVASELHEEAIVLEEQIIRLYFRYEYYGHKIDTSELNNIEALKGAIKVLEISETGFKVIHDYEYQARNKKKQQINKEIEFANKIDSIRAETPITNGAKNITAREACKIYREKLTPHMKLESIQNRLSIARKIRKQVNNPTFALDKRF